MGAVVHVSPGVLTLADPQACESEEPRGQRVPTRLLKRGPSNGHAALEGIYNTGKFTTGVNYRLPYQKTNLTSPPGQISPPLSPTNCPLN